MDLPEPTPEPKSPGLFWQFGFEPHALRRGGVGAFAGPLKAMAGVLLLLVVVMAIHHWIF